MTETKDVAWSLDRLRAYRQQIIELAAGYGVFNIRVFGSVARDEANPDSDIDLLVSASDGVSMFDLVDLWLELQDLLGTDVSLITDDDHPRRQHLLANAHRDAVSL